MTIRSRTSGAVRDLTSDLRPDDIFLLFFAGHGFRVGESHVLVCSNDLYDDVKDGEEGLQLRSLKRKLSDSFGGALFIDACKSNTLATRGGDC